MSKQKLSGYEKLAWSFLILAILLVFFIAINLITFLVWSFIQLVQAFN